MPVWEMVVLGDLGRTKRRAGGTAAAEAECSAAGGVGLCCVCGERGSLFTHVC